MPHVVVLIPGIMGSVLELDGEVVWPGRPLELLLPYKKMAKLLDPRTTSTGVILKYLHKTQYRAIIDDLTELGFTAEDGTQVVFHYDWRQANEITAARLAQRLDDVVAQLGPDTEFTLLAHSMGGLISRYFLESGTFTGRPGLAAVRRLVTLGTPHRGAPLALLRILGLDKALWLSAAQFQEATNDPRYPSAYQLLPPPGEPFTWDDADTQGLANVDVYNPDAGLGLNLELLKAAAAFHAALDPNKRPPGVRYFCYSGTRHATTTTAVLRRVGGTWEVRKVERDGGGDGTVPFWSSALPGFQSFAVGSEHGILYQDRELRRTLGYILGNPDVLGALPFATADGLTVDLSVRDRVIEPGADTRLVIAPLGVPAAVRGVLHLERTDNPTADTPDYTPAGPPVVIQYDGPAVDALTVHLPGPAAPGAYRVAFRPDGTATSSLLGHDEFFVQMEIDPA
jgi:phospholipase A1